jgi:hypothetical protein
MTTYPPFETKAQRDMKRKPKKSLVLDEKVLFSIVSQFEILHYIIKCALNYIEFDLRCYTNFSSE